VRKKHATSQLPRLRGDIGPVALLDVTPRPGHPRTITNSIGMTLTLIPPGEFMMGSDATDTDAQDDEFLDKASGKKEKHRVRITRPFHLGVTEVTRGQFRRFVDDAGYRTEAEKDGKGGYGWNEEKKEFEQNPRYNWQNAGFEQTDDHPVVNVSWNDAQAFIAWLSRKEGQTYRLPTEAEWEYACRAGTTTRFACGDDPEGLAAVGNVADGTAKEKYPDWKGTIAARDGFVYTAPAGRYRSNAFGLFDMHGNVWEWCSDGYAAGYYEQSPADDPTGSVGSQSRAIRGGGWYTDPRNCRSAFRFRYAQGDRYDYLGFRVALAQTGG
jgi:formylglycine-generating enzyme required for sulfatase activity